MIAAKNRNICCMSKLKFFSLHLPALATCRFVYHSSLTFFVLLHSSTATSVTHSYASFCQFFDTATLRRHHFLMLPFCLLYYHTHLDYTVYSHATSPSAPYTIYKHHTLRSHRTRSSYTTSQYKLPLHSPQPPTYQSPHPQPTLR